MEPADSIIAAVSRADDEHFFTAAFWTRPVGGASGEPLWMIVAITCGSLLGVGAIALLIALPMCRLLRKGRPSDIEGSGATSAWSWSGNPADTITAEDLADAIRTSEVHLAALFDERVERMGKEQQEAMERLEAANTRIEVCAVPPPTRRTRRRAPPSPRGTRARAQRARHTTQARLEVTPPSPLRFDTWQASLALHAQIASDHHRRSNKQRHHERSLAAASAGRAQENPAAAAAIGKALEERLARDERSRAGTRAPTSAGVPRRDWSSWTPGTDPDVMA